MKEEKTKYCRECGAEKKKYFTGKFNEETGKKVNSFHCENTRCEYGCGNVTGHQHWSAWRNKCMDCGYSVQDY